MGGFWWGRYNPGHPCILVILILTVFRGPVGRCQNQDLRDLGIFRMGGSLAGARHLQNLITAARLVQAVLEVSALSRGRGSAGRVHFDNEVEAFIIQSGVVYDVDFSVMGRRESHRFKFHVNSGRNLLVQPITAATESAAHTWAERWAYRFSDTTAEASHMRPIAVLDDRGNRKNAWSAQAQAPIKELSILWTDKERLLEMLQP